MNVRSFEEQIYQQKVNRAKELGAIKVTEDQKEPQFFGGITGGLDNSVKDYFGAGITLSGEKTLFDAQKTDLSISSLKIQRLLSEIQLTALLENQSLALASSYVEILEAEGIVFKCNVCGTIPKFVRIRWAPHLCICRHGIIRSHGDVCLNLHAG